MYRIIANMSALQKTISRKLEESGISIRELERRAGLKQSCLNNIILGRTRSPSIEIAQAIAKELNCTIDDLLHEPSNHQRNFSWDKNLFRTCSNYVNDYIEKKNIQPRKIQTPLKCIEDIYEFCSKKKSFDEIFAEWCCERTF